MKYIIKIFNKIYIISFFLHYLKNFYVNAQSPKFNTCRKVHRIYGSKIFWNQNNNIQFSNAILDTKESTVLRVAHQNVYFWPSLSNHEKHIIRSAFHQISRRTCIKFNELDYKPWYHADRWVENNPYVIIRKSKKFTGYTDNNIAEINRRSLLYITDNALNHHSINQSRGMVMTQLLRYMGFRDEHLRPDAPSYIQPISNKNKLKNLSSYFSKEQLQWPFDPESITIPSSLRKIYTLTMYCKARTNNNIGAAQRAGLLTRWDSIKLNSMYCPQNIIYANPREGPCVVPRKPQNAGF